jgi:hypothetical protein
VPPPPFLTTASKRLSRGVSFGLDQEILMRCIPTTYDAGHRHNVCFNGMRGFGQEPAVPAIPKPPLPGYVTEEDHQAALAAQQAAIDKDMKTKHLMLGGGGLLVGWLVGYMVGKR